MEIKTVMLLNGNHSILCTANKKFQSERSSEGAPKVHEPINHQYAIKMNEKKGILINLYVLYLSYNINDKNTTRK